jgi:predicted alpha/beta superfamily hydrolase
MDQSVYLLLVMKILLAGLLLYSSVVFALPSRVEEMEIGGRKVSVYVPPNIQKGQSYPILIFTDGQTCFGSGFETMQLELLADSLIRNRLITPSFIIGIWSDGRRMDDYIPYHDSSIFLDFGLYRPEADKLVGFIKNDLLPALKLKFPINDKTGIAGFSFGGLFASWAALHYPELFSFAAAFSPSMWVADYKIFEEAKMARPEQVYYLDIGTAEWNYYIPFVKNSGLESGKNIFYHEVEDAAHMIYYVKQRVHNALLLFAPLQEPDKFKWSVKTEVIESPVQAGRFYLRLNPLIEFKNGLRYTLYGQVKYKLQDEATGVVNEDGSFKFNGTDDMVVIVSFDGREKKVVIKYKEIEKLKKGKH